jgi:hypothetical protein
MTGVVRHHGHGLAYAGVAAMMPRAGGQYVFLPQKRSRLCGDFCMGGRCCSSSKREASPAVSVAFAKFLGVLVRATSVRVKQRCSMKISFGGTRASVFALALGRTRYKSSSKRNFTRFTRVNSWVSPSSCC